MNWIYSLLESARSTLEAAGTSPLALLPAFLLGIMSAVASACCTLPVLGGIVGYAGIEKSSDRRTNILGALSFMIGTIIALLILGSVAGLISQVAQDSLGKYWKIFAGILAIILGLGTLNLLPFKLGRANAGQGVVKHRGLLGSAIFGLVMGGAVSVCSLACNPGIYIILGVAVLQGYTTWMFGVLTAFAIGFSLPLTLLVLGVSLGKTAMKFRNAERVIHFVAGIVLIGVGFYFLSSF